MNKNSLSIIFLFISQFACLWTNGQSQFYKKLNGFSVSYEIKALATTDGGWLTGGTSNGVKLVKYDKCGRIQWSKYYTSASGIDYVEIVASAFGGYAITGYWGPRSNADTYLLKLNDNGNVIYCKQYLAASSEFPYSLGEDSNGNFFINGNTINGGGLGNNFILKTDSLGNIIWSRLYADGGSWGRAIMCKDDGILRCGGWGNIYKVDNSGSLLWSKYGYWGVREKPLELNNGFVFSYDRSTQLFKIDPLGNLVWQTKQYLTNANPLQRLEAAPSGNIILVGDSAAIEFNSSGKYLRHNSYRNPASGKACNLTGVSKLKDNSFIIAGYDAGPANGGTVFNSRIDSFLNSKCAAFNSVLDTLTPPVFTIRDTSFIVTSISFTEAAVTVTAVDFDPLEEIVCTEYDSLKLVTSIPDSICAGEAAALSVINQSTGHFNFNWYAGSCGGTSVGTGMSLNVLPQSTETFFLKAEGCDTTACIPLTVNVKTKPEAKFDAAFTFDCSGITANLTNESTNGDSYLWSFNDGYSSSLENISRKIFPNGTVAILLIASNNNGCKDTAQLAADMNSVVDYFHIVIPNIFSPNNDGVNDVFGITAPAGLSACLSIIIFDRWGKEIFSAENNNFKWDGQTKANVKAAAGTYFYLLTINDTEYKGQITLVE